jgi:hypothetical protein
MEGTIVVSMSTSLTFTMTEEDADGDSGRDAFTLDAVRVDARVQRDRSASTPLASTKAPAARRTIVPPGGMFA